MKLSILFLLFTLPVFATSITDKNENSQGNSSRTNKNFFIENRGQWPSEVKYLARVGGMNAWITSTGVVYDYFQIIKNDNKNETSKIIPGKKEEFERENTTVKGHVVKMQLLDANTMAVNQGNDKKECYYNYFIGNDQSKWASFVPLYGDIAINEIYKDINVKYYFDGNNIRYDYVVKPGADLSLIKLKFEGQYSFRINDSGELILITSLGEVTNGKLYSYQNIGGANEEVFSRFVQNPDGTISFDVPDYNKEEELIIDPLIYSTFIGGDWDDLGLSIKVNSANNAFITGNTLGAGYPVTPGAYDYFDNGGWDCFVTKFNSTGTDLVYSTFIGGGYHELNQSITLDANGNVFISGKTESTNYPTSSGAFQTYNHGGSDIFVSKFNSSGSSLIYSTLIGGTGNDDGNSIALDAEGNAYITGRTSSLNYPVTSGVFQSNIGGGGADGFVTKLNFQGTGLVFSTYLGGDNYEALKNIAVDPQGNAYITGNTSSANFPITAGAFQTIKNGSECGIVCKLNPSGTNLVYSTFLGGSSYSQGKAITVDNLGFAFLTGMTNSSDFPVTNGAFQTIYKGNYDVFITKLNLTGNSLVYSTFIGGSNNDTPYSIVIDTSGNAYISGETNSVNFPIVPGSYQTFNNGNNDAFITKLNPTGNSLMYSSYLGGLSNDQGRGTAIDNSFNSYILGYTNSTNYPVTPGAFQTTSNGAPEVFLTKLNLDLLPLKVTVPNGGEIWKGGEVKSIAWEAVGVSNIKIQYSTNKGASWNTISESYPTISGSFSWTVPVITSAQTLIRISDVLNSSTSDTSNSAFIIWQVVTNTQNTTLGQNNLIFGPTNLLVNLFASNPKPITVTYYDYEAPLPGALPPNVFGVSGYYWKVFSSDSIVFNNGVIKVPVIKLRNPGPFFVWLKRSSPNDTWTDIGGTIIDGYFVNTTLLSSFSEFAVGFYHSPTA
ncbi:MAG: SBBP repeat-containing protein, partial [Methanococcaceae archaeon]